ncbi:MAG: methylated-DNA--[protein]-cysteine S-methyltransferase [Verrucomicrobia bacterium]|nr:methylated-DNA--[protein]-cysteine S-methyltransferase [Verrucomicrobiota bacterium]
MKNILSTPNSPQPSATASGDYARIERAIEFLRANYLTQPDLDEVARQVHLSPFHFQRLFTRWAGVSPKRFLQFLTVEHAKTRLAKRDVLSTALDSGLSGPSRLHDLFVSVEALTPGEFKRGGAGLTIHHGTAATPFGLCLLATTVRGVCSLSFINDTADGDAALNELRARWPTANLVHDETSTQLQADAIFHQPLSKRAPARPIPLLLAGTNFQIQVWRALLRIPSGAVSTYEAVAQSIGQPKAARAVGGAVGKNTLAYLIPCHRVIKKTGVFGEYRWGATRKQALLGWETARAEAR